MPTIQILSDIHIERYGYTPDPHEFITPSAQVLILAGDIGRIHKFNQLKEFLTEICKLFQVVFYTPGNHEYYKVMGVPEKNMDELYLDLMGIKDGIPNLYILHRDSRVIDGFCFIGATLWSDIQVPLPKFIVKIKGLTTNAYREMHKTDLSFIEDSILYCQKNNLIPIVITHHCPSFQFTSRHRQDRFGTLYASNLDRLLNKENAKMWIFGHLHINFDLYTEGGTRIVTNQRGKGDTAESGFVKNKVITL